MKIQWFLKTFVYMAIALGAHTVTTLQAAESTPNEPLQSEIVLDVDEERLARALEDEFIAPCCWHQPISVHDSQIARTMRHEIRQMIRNGMSAEQIRQFYISRYGERIMAVPHGGGFNHFAWLVPAVAGGLGVLGAGYLLRTWRKKGHVEDNAQTQSDADSTRFAKVDEQLRRWSD